jgi:hypothetical protein
MDLHSTRAHAKEFAYAPLLQDTIFGSTDNQASKPSLE